MRFRKSVTVPAIDLPHYLHRIGTPTIELLKVDCEGCEVPLLSTPRAHMWFVDRTRVRRVGAEIHLSKMGAFDAADVSAARKAFKARGCQWAWQAEC